jgi:hypothetical protein
MELKTTYTIESGPEAPSFEEYVTRTQASLIALLSRDPEERELQEFLEKNPAIVPGARTPGRPSGHYPLHCALISQPSLPGLSSRRPDFMWIPSHSATWYTTLIEIERLSKKLFTRKDLPTADFSQARNQLAEWRTWFSSPANVQKFIEEYGIPAQYLQFMTWKLHMILIFGRRSEFQSKPMLSKHRAALMSAPDEELMSYDRLGFDTDLRDAITVRAVGFGRYRVLAVPPTFSTGPSMADRLLHIDGFSDAIDKNLEIPEPRREFLKRRIPYWREWAAKGRLGIINSGLRE